MSTLKYNVTTYIFLIIVALATKHALIKNSINQCGEHQDESSFCLG
jgi:hypothetical protein